MKYFSPRYMLLWPLLIWLFLFIMAPLSYNINPSTYALLVLCLYIGSYYLGTFFYDLLPQKNKKEYIGEKNILNNKKINTVFNILLFLALLGLLLRFYDLFISKSFLSYSSGSELKMLYDQDGADYGLVNILSAILFPFVINLAIFVTYYYEKISPIKRIVTITLVSGFLFYMILLGSRTTITLFLIIVLTVLAILEKFNNVNFKKIIKITVSSLLFTIIFIYYTGAILSERLFVQGHSFASALAYLENAHHLTLSPSFWNITYSGEEYTFLVYLFSHLTHYFLHGFYQFFDLVDKFNTENILYGSAQFFTLFKFFRVIGLSNITIADIIAITPEYGVYTSFFGPVYLDFGLIGSIYCFLLGLLAQHFWQKSLVHYTSHRFMVYPFIAAVIFHAPFLNMLQYGGGFYILISSIISEYVIKRNLKRD